MEERRGYPPVAMRWNIEGENHEFAATAFHAIVAASGLKVLSEHELTGKREQLRPDSVAGRSILWCERDRRRSHLLDWPENEAIVLIKQNSETVEVLVANNDLDSARKILAEIDRLLPREPINGDTVLPIIFWHQGEECGEATIRHVELVHWADLAPNYAGETRTRLASLMDGFKPAKNDGRLLLWHGEPGTGKTFAIRALAWAWRDWCHFEYVIDPEQLLGRGSYLTEVVLNCMPGHFMFEDKPNSEPWRLLIVEDSGEMMAMDAKEQIGQGLSRLLNLSDGILGQGTKILILVTTNEDLGNLNSAIRRHGRCLSEIDFRRFETDEAAAWLRNAGCEAQPEGPQTLSELYAIRAGRDPVIKRKEIGFRPKKLGVDHGSTGVLGFAASGSRTEMDKLWKGKRDC
jgi:hypothetical protein